MWLKSRMEQIEPRKARDLAAAEEVQPEVQDEVFPYVPSPTETVAPDRPGTATDRARTPSNRTAKVTASKSKKYSELVWKRSNTLH